MGQLLTTRTNKPTTQLSWFRLRPCFCCLYSYGGILAWLDTQCGASKIERVVPISNRNIPQGQGLGWNMLEYEYEVRFLMSILIGNIHCNCTGSPTSSTQHTRTPCNVGRNDQGFPGITSIVFRSWNKYQVWERNWTPLAQEQKHSIGISIDLLALFIGDFPNSHTNYIFFMVFCSVLCVDPLRLPNLPAFLLPLSILQCACRHVQFEKPGPRIRGMVSMNQTIMQIHPTSVPTHYKRPTINQEYHNIKFMLNHYHSCRQSPFMFEAPSTTYNFCKV